MQKQKKRREKSGCLKNKGFLVFTVSAMLNRLGDSIDTLAVSWLMFQISRSAALSAAALGVNFLPTLILQPAAGALVERMPKRRVIAAADLGRAALVAIMIGAYAAKVLTPWALLLLTFLISVLEAFRNPAAMAEMARLLKPEQYDRGAGVYQSVSRIMELAGTGAAGILIAAAGIEGALAVDGVCFLLSAVSAALIRSAREGRGSSARKKNGREAGAGFQAELLEGIRYLKGSKNLAAIAVEALFLNIVVTPVNALLTPLVREVYRKGSGTLSLISGCLSLGMLAGAAAYAFFAERLKYGAMFLTCGMLNAAVYLILAFAGAIADKALLFEAVMGATGLLFGTALGLLNTALAARMMRDIEQTYMARVSAWMNALCTAAVPLTSFLISGMLTVVSEKTVLVGFSALGAAGCLAIRSIRTARRPRERGLSAGRKNEARGGCGPAGE